jgi:hypothetical protein
VLAETTSVTPERSAMGPVRKTLWVPSARRTTAWFAAQWSIADWMRAVSRECSARVGMMPLVAVMLALSVVQAEGMCGSVTVRVSCAKRVAEASRNAASGF